MLGQLVQSHPDLANEPNRSAFLGGLLDSALKKMDVKTKSQLTGTAGDVQFDEQYEAEDDNLAFAKHLSDSTQAGLPSESSVPPWQLPVPLHASNRVYKADKSQLRTEAIAKPVSSAPSVDLTSLTAGHEKRRWFDQSVSRLISQIGKRGALKNELTQFSKDASSYQFQALEAVEDGRRTGSFRKLCHSCQLPDLESKLQALQVITVEALRKINHTGVVNSATARYNARSNRSSHPALSLTTPLSNTGADTATALNYSSRLLSSQGRQQQASFFNGPQEGKHSWTSMSPGFTETCPPEAAAQTSAVNPSSFHAEHQVPRHASYSQEITRRQYSTDGRVDHAWDKLVFDAVPATYLGLGEPPKHGSTPSFSYMSLPMNQQLGLGRIDASSMSQTSVPAPGSQALGQMSHFSLGDPYANDVHPCNTPHSFSLTNPQIQAPGMAPHSAASGQSGDWFFSPTAPPGATVSRNRRYRSAMQLSDAESFAAELGRPMEETALQDVLDGPATQSALYGTLPDEESRYPNTEYKG